MTAKEKRGRGAAAPAGGHSGLQGGRSFWLAVYYIPQRIQFIQFFSIHDVLYTIYYIHHILYSTCCIHHMQFSLYSIYHIEYGLYSIHHIQ